MWNSKCSCQLKPQTLGSFLCFAQHESEQIRLHSGTRLLRICPAFPCKPHLLHNLNWANLSNAAGTRILIQTGLTLRKGIILQLRCSGWTTFTEPSAKWRKERNRLMDKEGSIWLPLWLVSREVKGSKHLVKETRSSPSITPSEILQCPQSKGQGRRTPEMGWDGPAGDNWVATDPWE